MLKVLVSLALTVIGIIFCDFAKFIFVEVIKSIVNNKYGVKIKCKLEIIFKP